MVVEVKMAGFKQGDVAWGYTTRPELSNPFVQPMKLQLESSFEWGGKTLWNCIQLDGNWRSGWVWDEMHLAPEPVRIEQPVVE